jgi:hypothetical protein
MNRRRRRNVLLTVALAIPLVVAHTGCASKAVARSSYQLCAAHGGQYSRETKQCTFAAATTVSGQKACENLAGVYVAQMQWCQFDQ